MSKTTTHRNLIIGGAALVAVVAMAASAATLAALGRAVGWGNVLSWALPVSVDVLALVAGLAWIAAGNGSSLGRVLTLLTVAVSVLLNALGHLVSTGHLTASPYLVIGVSAVPPLAAALAVHLGATVTTDRTAPRADHARADHERGPAEGAGPAGADQGAPADQMPDREHPRTADDAARTTDQPAGSTPADHDAPAPDHRTNPVPDHDADHNGPTADQPADHPARARTRAPRRTRCRTASTRGSPTTTRGPRTNRPAPPPRTTTPRLRTTGPTRCRTTTRTTTVLPRTSPQTTRRSNELFSDLQAALYADPALAHLPRDTRRAR
ncbi:DUF2637 domain-containing protein [Streptomyces sp. NRRL F-5650]|uniref:DUF2637 domain-containing protein n=1 Tax=Streptomyces sp. NRRL F-5650 TaxID=1463868 RepID=UPI0004C9A75E|nr:DUF2637 domain-containing protein [Streptomyces sp. NRRL F-5650]